MGVKQNFKDINGNVIEDNLCVETDSHGLMCPEDKTKLDGIAAGANKTIVDSSLSSTSTNPVQNKVVNAALNKKANDFSIELYNGTGGNPKPVRFASFNYSTCASEEGIAAKISLVSGHGNGSSYAFLEDAIIRVTYLGTVEVDNFKYYGQSCGTYDGESRQYGDIFWLMDETNKIVDFYVLMGQYARVNQTPWKRLTHSTKGTVTQHTSCTVYSTGTKNWANNSEIATKGDIPAETNLSDYYKKSEITTLLAAKSDTTHTHNYAGSSSAGGAATSANKLNSNAGSATQPVYFEDGIPKSTTYTLGASVPSGAKFTDTTYSANNGISLSGTTFSNSGVRSVSTGSTNGTISVNTNGTAAEVAVKGLGSAAYTNSSAYDAAGAANTALNNAKSYTDTKVADLLENSTEAVDSIYELRDAMSENADAISALETIAGNKANASDLTSHTGNTTVHITSTERTNWNAAKTHAGSAHAPSNAEANQNAFSNVTVGSTTISADSKTDTLTLVAGSNVTLTPDATNDKITIAATNTDTNTSHGHSAGVGLTGSGSAGTGNGTYTYKAKLRSETALTIDSAAATTTSGRVYPVSVDKSGYLAVNVPWTDTDTKYTHPTYTAKSSGLYKVTVDGTGHVSAATAVAKADITGLGIPGSDTNTTYDLSAPASATNGNVKLNLTAGGSGSGTDSVSIKGSGATTVTTDANGVITISSTDNNTVYTHPTYTAKTGVPTANATLTHGGTFTVTQPVSDGTGHITAMNTRTYTLPAAPTIPTTLKNPNSLTVQGNGTTSFTYDGSAAKTLNIKAGSNVSVSSDTSGNITISSTDTNTVYTHPTYTAKSSGLYKVTVDGTGHVSAATAVTKADITGLGIPGSDTNTHYASKNVVGSSTATSNTTTALTNGNVYLNSVENGAVTSAHKISGSGATTVTTDTSGNIIISSTDNNTVYTHPTHTAKSSGLYKITVDSSGHVSAATAVAKADITALGIPGSDTNTVTTATTSGSGNAVTAVTASNGALTVTKGDTFVNLSSAQTISGVKTFSNGIKIGSGTITWDSSASAFVFSF